MYVFLKSLLVFALFSCTSDGISQQKIASNLELEDDSLTVDDVSVKVAAEIPEQYISKLTNLKVGIVANQTSRVDTTHLVDFLIAQKVNVISVFSPEHGFRGDADAGAKVESSIDQTTGLPLISLYGKNKKPTTVQVEDLDIVVFDIQDVGARFYTYISTLHYVMEACAENNVRVMVLDRPNPNGHIIDGPVRENGLKSFVSMHPIPVLHGMTIGEYAQMINGEKWLKNGIQCDLEVIKCANYTHLTPYSLPIAPSPNLQSDAAIALYPSLCLFEGTPVSVGRGTPTPFEMYGHPNLKGRAFTFTPKPSYGAKSPRLNGKLCYGANLTAIGDNGLQKLRIDWLIACYQDMGSESFFTTKNNWFDKLAGSSSLRKQIENNVSEQKIRASWEPALSAFKAMRTQYLLYP